MHLPKTSLYYLNIKSLIAAAVLASLTACGGSSGTPVTSSSSQSSVASSSSSSESSSLSSESSSSSSVSSATHNPQLTCTMPNGQEGVSAITVDGNRVLFGGVQDSIAGPSLFWSNDGWGGEKYYTPEVVAWVKEDWNAKLIRAAMGAHSGGDYMQSPTSNMNKVITVVDAAIENDMYVIIDWHSHHAEDHEADAIAFFAEMARCYGNYENVIYEIYNEPLNTTSWPNTIKPYAEAVIAAIRAEDPDNLIIVGTPTWSQDVDVASNDPITGYDNIAYALHFYAGTHTQFLRDKATTAINNGIALFATEWGAVNANGDGDVVVDETLEWMAFFKDNQISHANWALNDKEEGASALMPGASTIGGWTEDDLTVSGKLVRDIIQNW